MEPSDLPTLNACLNVIAALFLSAGYYWIRRGETARHRRCMLLACSASAMFLVSYVIYHVQVGSVRFEREGWIRPVYFAVLITHVTLAIAIVPLVLLTVGRALRGSFERHRRVARWTWPLWMYVSVSGVAVYAMLYHL